LDKGRFGGILLQMLHVALHQSDIQKTDRSVTGCSASDHARCVVALPALEHQLPHHERIALRLQRCVNAAVMVLEISDAL
jgi:hypothetical protein